MRRAMAVIVLALIATSCGLGDDPSVPQTEPSASAEPTPEPTPCVIEDARTTARSAELGEDVAQVADLRWSNEDACPRVVFEFQDQISSYEVAYSDDIAECGSGETPPTDEWDAEAFLKVTLEPAGGPDPTSESGEPVYKGPRDIDVDGTILRHMKVICDFEAVFTWVLALDEEHPFEVVAMSDPARLVIDVSGA